MQENERQGGNGNDAMNPLRLLIWEIEPQFPHVARSHKFPSFAGIAEDLPPFLSFCVSVSRHRGGHPGTSSHVLVAVGSVHPIR